MLNASKLRNAAASRSSGLVKNNYGGGNDKFPWINPSSFKPGSHLIRICPRDPIKCPNNFHVYTKYQVEKEAGDDKIPVLAMESWSPESDDVILSVLECYDQVKNHLSHSVQEAIEGMFPKKYFLFPCSVVGRLIEEPAASGKKYKKILPDSSGEEFGIILAIEQTSEKEPPLFKRIVEIADMYPQMTMEDETGRYLKLTRTGEGLQTRYTLDAMPTAEPMRNPALLADYPDFTKFGKNYKKDEFAMKSLIKSCWWWEPLSEFVEL